MDPTRDGKDREFEDLVQAYYRPLYQFAYSLARQEAEASDLTQQTFYIWARKGRALRDPSKAKTWLFTTLHREFLKSRRHLRMYPHRAIEDGDGDLPAPSSSAVEQLDSGAVIEMLARVERFFARPWRCSISGSIRTRKSPTFSRFPWAPCSRASPAGRRSSASC